MAILAPGLRMAANDTEAPSLGTGRASPASILPPVRLVIVRHAEAEPGEPDELRRLTAAGRRAASAVGERLAREGLSPDAVLTSPLLRARETGAEIARAAGIAAEPDERLLPGATADAVRDAVAGRGETVVVVGHQPDCGLVAAALGGGPEPRFPPAGTAVVELPG
jgi:phosphohistidine phosphatase